MLALRELEVLDALDRGVGRADDALDELIFDRTGADPSELPLGARDRALIELRVATFGPLASVRINCVNCNEQLEAELDLTALPSDSAEADSIAVELDGRAVRVRLPRLADLRAARRADDPRVELIRRCCGDVRLDDMEITTVERAIEEADPMIDVSVELRCPACADDTNCRFDVSTHLWSEMERYGRRLTLEVHRLATRYGWTEAEVLALSPVRRRSYLELGSS